MEQPLKRPFAGLDGWLASINFIEADRWVYGFGKVGQQRTVNLANALGLSRSKPDLASGILKESAHR
jgi:hypothetical protein